MYTYGRTDARVANEGQRIFRRCAVRALPPTMAQISTDEAHGYDCAFVKKKKEIQTDCLICCLVLREPAQMMCCGNLYCIACIRKELGHRNVCPTCNKKYPTYFRDKRIKQTLSGFRVHCIHYTKQGEGEGGGGSCYWVGQLGDLERHLNKNPPEDTKMNGCLFVEITCKFCANHFQRSLTDDHQSNHCPERPYSCPHCHHSSTYIEITEVHIQICPCFPTECPHCSEVLERQHLELHINSDCLLAPTACDFLLVGCQEQLPRAQMKSHVMRNCVHHAQMFVDYAKEHSDDSLKQYLPMLTICVEILTTQMDVISTLWTENENLLKELSTQNKAQLKKISSLTEQNETQRKEMSTLRRQARAHREEISTLKRMNEAIVERISTLRTQNEADEKEIFSLQTDNEGHKKKIAIVTSQNNAQQKEILTLRAKNKSHMKEISTLKTQNKAQKGCILTLQKRNEDYMEKIATLETQNEEYMEEISTLTIIGIIGIIGLLIVIAITIAGLN